MQCNGASRTSLSGFPTRRGLMNKENFTIRLSRQRRSKLKLYSEQKDKTMTQVIEEMIDKLKLSKDTGG